MMNRILSVIGGVTCSGIVGCGLPVESELGSEAATIQIVDSPATEQEEGDKFGQALAFGDFDGDGDDDLAVGVPGQNVDGEGGVGTVVIHYGATGPTQLVTPTGIPGVERGDTFFGRALAAGDFDGDGEDDLAIGAPGAGAERGGVVVVLYGSEDGLELEGHQMLSQATLAGSPEAGDRFGASLASGRFNGDFRHDLVIGAPGENLGSAVDGGAIHVIPGSSSGLSPASGNQLLHQNASGVAGEAGANERFGESFATGRLNDDGFEDLVVGIPGKIVGGARDAGMVHVFFGSASLLRTTDDQQLSQDSPGIAGGAEGGDGFGTSIACGDFNGDTFDEIAVGVPRENNQFTDDGVVVIVSGSASGPTASGSYMLSSAPRATADDHFGAALTTGRFNGDALDDLAVGAPGVLTDTGSVLLFLGGTAGSRPADHVFFQSGKLWGAPRNGDRFGEVLASGYFSGNDAFADVAMGTPDDLGFVGDPVAGCVDVLPGDNTWDMVRGWHITE